jgi:hypothetical protein
MEVVGLKDGVEEEMVVDVEGAGGISTIPSSSILSVLADGVAV